MLLLTGLLKGSIYAQPKQREVLLKQIAALKMYTGYAQKGYSIAKKGLNTIGNFKRGEFDLHADYFNSLKIINPKIKDYSRVSQIIVLQVKILDKYKSTLKQVQEDDLFHGDEVAYIKRVMNRLIKNGDTTLDELIVVLTQGNLEMKDDERINKIDFLYQNMLESYIFCESFSDQTRMMSLSRSTNFKDVKTSRVLQGVKNNVP
ncbi:hypothetical protein [Flavobacterium yafengii]|uniref:TerB family tellurite resistance protein n=1 Tax=Flavobacterium yafengii TaxID=3041253 RepID=A0AAW6TKZ8_9FLAO|nr:hypothetical protein [Flavobacterium yafengii]MDI5950245.1 hypothetical protein [Flavobacterium yafengii]